MIANAIDSDPSAKARLELNPDTIKALLDAFDRGDWRE